MRNKIFQVSSLVGRGSDPRSALARDRASNGISKSTISVLTEKRSERRKGNSRVEGKKKVNWRDSINLERRRRRETNKRYSAEN